MTNFTKTLALAAAALLIATGAASAQTLKADIPFAFQVGKQLLPAGTYDISNLSHSAAPILALRGDGVSAMAMGNSPHDPDRAWVADGKPRLTFRCGGTCELDQVWSGRSYSAYSVSRPKSSDIGTRIAVIVIRDGKGD